MLISLNWIKDYVNLDGVRSEEITKRFTLSTAEIEDVYQKGANVSGVVFAKILSVEAHPNSDHLHILQVDKGDEVVQIVCGAPNVRKDMVTCLATIGGEVCSMKIKPAKLAGVESFGMCCSEAELGIGSDDSGIIDVKEDVIIGEDIKKHWQIDDTIIEVDNKSLTNRPDLWGHFGLAREFSAIFGKELKNVDVIDLEQYSKLKKVDINVETDKCFRYSAMTVDNINIKKSPMNIKIRLNYVGVRDINLLADLTNYVMLDIGEPMHAFDNSKVKAINVIIAKAGDKLITLEGENHDIPENAILIANENREPVAVAGIKGGLLSGITDATNSLLLEGATFDAEAIRKASLAIGLRTDASLRYEKTLDPEITKVAIARLLKLLTNIDNSIVITSAFSDVYNYRYPTRKIEITSQFISSRIGMQISDEQIIKTLNSLEFKAIKNDDKIDVTVPSFRATKDVSIKEDLVEEVARMIGYDNIEPENITSVISPIEEDKEHICEFESKKLLANKFGANEVHTYIWCYDDFNKEYKIKTSPVVNLLDSTNSGQSGIRSELAPSLLKVESENINANDNIKIFEIARVAASLNEDKIVNEEKHLSIVIASANNDEKTLYFELKEMILAIGKCVVGAEITFDTAKNGGENYHPINSCTILAGGKQIGVMGITHPNIKLGKKIKVAMLEIDFFKLCSVEEKQIKILPVSKYQEVNLDFNFVVDYNTSYSTITEIIDSFRCNYNVDYLLKDVYINQEQLPGKKSMTFTFTISSNDHTLSSKEIDGFSFRIVDLMKRNNIILR